MTETKHRILEAEEKANYLFKAIKHRGLITAGKTERQLNNDIFNLAFELFGIKKYWHKRIVRAGKNTLLPYEENPSDLILQDDDIVFFDFGPVFENWEADIGKTFVLGNDSRKLKLKRDIEMAWVEGKEFYDNNRLNLSGADFYEYTKKLAKKYGWDYGNIYCGHLIGKFSHEKIIGEETINYIHPDNNQLMCELDKNGNERFWIYEIHFIDKRLEIGGFFEQLLS
ncbi:MAG: M24 family metallopeptidase [Bacteroidales bacterium]|jgi:Xaa-Pro dipeptidase|nr:M24 family metallopeptidase [Bacteroidales bacterium]